MMTEIRRQARSGTAGVYLEGVRVIGRPDGPLLAREEQQLVEGLLGGNEDAVRALYARYGRPIFTLGLRLLGMAIRRQGENEIEHAARRLAGTALSVCRALPK